jgi:hypothetical protein
MVPIDCLVAGSAAETIKTLCQTDALGLLELLALV